jgi:hypothetical protein
MKPRLPAWRYRRQPRQGLLGMLCSALLIFGSPWAVAASPASPANNPCKPADPGYGIYAPWLEDALPLGRLLMPRKGGLTTSGAFDLVIHFHGSGAIRKALARTARGVFVVGVDLGVGSRVYGQAFARPEAFEHLLDAIEHQVARHRHIDQAHIRKLTLSGWSAGYGAIRAILRQPASDRVNALILIDSLHSDYLDAEEAYGLQPDQLAPFVRFAKLAARGKRFMFVSHSRIIPPGYASTMETAHYLVSRLGGRVDPTTRRDGPWLSRYEQGLLGDFFMRGYEGNSKYDHCAHISLISEVIATLEQRWHTPQASGRSTGLPRALNGDIAARKPPAAERSGPVGFPVDFH